MGRRRIRCLQYLGEKDIIGFDIRKDRCEETSRRYGIKTFSDFNEACGQNPDVFIISVPSNLHHFYAMEAIKRNKHFFTESNFLPEGIDDLLQVEKEGKIICVPSFTMPHHPLVKIMRSGIEEAGYSVHTHEEMYIEEMENFVKMVRGEKKYPYTFTQEKHIIDILVAIEQSISQKIVMEVEDEV